VLNKASQSFIEIFVAKSKHASKRSWSANLLLAGCNVGDMYVVTNDGFENLSRHTPA
jgi:hypothetical protein